MPVGKCVRRTAEYVVFTLCPPGPEEQKVSTRTSFGFELDFYFVRFRQNGHGNGGGVDAALGFGLGTRWTRCDCRFRTSVGCRPCHR